MNRDANTPGFIQVGHVLRSHGLEGELKVFFDVSDPQEIENLKLVYLRNDRGDFYPARITDMRVEGKRNDISFFVQFDHIADRTGAEALKNRGIFLEVENAEPFLKVNSETEDSLVDHEVFDDDESIGLVIDVMNNPAHPILVVATTSGSRLIPYVDHFVKTTSDGNIYCQNLDELEGI
ncbi:MAG: 16S rRNA processing protein RimM [Gracilimonas sp.]|uniref:ribosome maturation factor RimM n=1 Tax=Gracilimonas sp. TaxID=1974203 RepID=UPI0019A0E4EF|nr:ribosome maturation factor RimM [Gracilimonas sp.]MBD3617060.1 16S rRNA processing protein RimM [Gracilimonas sp.]